MKKTLLWIAVLPGALAIYVIAYAFFKLLGTLSAHFGDPDDYHWITNVTMPALSAGLAIYAFLKVGVFIAPAYKFHTLIFLIIIGCAYVLLAAFLIIAYKFEWKTFFEAVGTIIGIISGFIEIRKELRKGGKFELI